MKPDALLCRRVPAPLGSPFPFALVPSDDRAAEALGKILLGEPVAIHVKRGRSLPQLRLYWAVLQHVADATHWETAERLHVALKVRLGLYDLMQLPNGKTVPVVQSASFDGMTHDAFTEYMDKAVNLICSEVCPGMSSAMLIEEAQAAIGISAPGRP